MYINELDEDITNNLSKFADDIKLGRNMKAVNDCQALQDDLDKIFDSSVKWQKEYNVDKCNKSVYPHRYYLLLAISQEHQQPVPKIFRCARWQIS